VKIEECTASSRENVFFFFLDQLGIVGYERAVNSEDHSRSEELRGSTD
jgi:hypothetical protein